MAWFMMHRILYALRDSMFSDRLAGTVEAEGTWVGDKFKGKGRAYKSNKVPEVSLVERNVRYNQRYVGDGARTLAGMKKIEGKWLMLRQPKVQVA